MAEEEEDRELSWQGISQRYSKRLTIQPTSPQRRPEQQHMAKHELQRRSCSFSELAKRELKRRRWIFQCSTRVLASEIKLRNKTCDDRRQSRQKH